MLISHFPGDSAFSSSLWPPPFSQLFPKVEVKFGKNEEQIRIMGIDPSFQDLKITVKGNKVGLCPSLFLFDFFIESQIQPSRYRSKSGKARGALLSSAKPSGRLLVKSHHLRKAADYFSS